MKYHNITKDDMLNGDGLRVVLWVSGCSHHCKGCQNPETWDCNSGLEFGEDELKEIFDELSKPWISGITFSGGDPLNDANQETILKLINMINQKYPDKTIWLYSGYKLDEIATNYDVANDRVSLQNAVALTNMGTRFEILKKIDVFVDGKFEETLKSESYPWAGSTNQIVWHLI